MLVTLPFICSPYLAFCLILLVVAFTRWLLFGYALLHVRCTRFGCPVAVLPTPVWLRWLPQFYTHTLPLRVCYTHLLLVWLVYVCCSYVTVTFTLPSYTLVWLVCWLRVCTFGWFWFAFLRLRLPFICCYTFTFAFVYVGYATFDCLFTFTFVGFARVTPFTLRSQLRLVVVVVVVAVAFLPHVYVQFPLRYVYIFGYALLRFLFAALVVARLRWLFLVTLVTYVYPAHTRYVRFTPFTLVVTFCVRGWFTGCPVVVAFTFWLRLHARFIRLRLRLLRLLLYCCCWFRFYPFYTPFCSYIVDVPVYYTFTRFCWLRCRCFAVAVAVYLLVS